jgi:hypothetical protein
MRLTKLIYVLILICFFGCNNNSSIEVDYNQEDNTYTIVPKEKLTLNSNEGNWYYKNIPFTGKAITYFPKKFRKKLFILKVKKMANPLSIS